MARVAAAALALLSTSSQALIHSQKESTLDCMCRDWADVYKAENNHNVTCGMGMELFYLMDQMNLGIDTNVRHKVALGKSSHATASALEQLKGTAAYGRFCTDFFMRSQFNYCVNKRFLMEQHQVKQSKGTWCYVSSKCTLPYIITQVPGTDLAVKQCSEVMDVSLGTLLVDQAGKLGKKHGLDQAMISGHAYLFKNLPVEKITGAVLREIQDTHETTFVWAQDTDEAWVVNDESIYKQKRDNVTNRWDTTCFRGCNL